VTRLEKIIDEVREENQRTAFDARLRSELGCKVSAVWDWLRRYGFPVCTKSWDANKQRCTVTGVMQAFGGQMTAPVVITMDRADRDVSITVEQENGLNTVVRCMDELYELLDKGCRKAATGLAAHESAVNGSKGEGEKA
jgi:hypothetical protein